MEQFKWTKKLCTNIEDIDNQHRELFQKIDNLALSIYSGESRLKLKEMLDFLENYINEHLNYEEKLMSLNNYEKLNEHTQEHDEFRILFGNIVEEFRSKGGDSYLAIRLEKEIRNWWEKHIINVDMKYVPFIKKID